MGECIIKRQGGAVDISDLTATPADVVAGEKFYGSGTDEIQTGTQKKIGKISKVLAANETYVIPAGYVDAGSAVTQNIVTQGAMTVNPVANGSLLNVSGKYMTGDITVNGVENLKPENIKKGVFIGSVSGTFEGYVNTDQLTPYWYGVFPPGQTGFYDSAFYQNPNSAGSSWDNYKTSVYAQMSVDWNYDVDDSLQGKCIRIEGKRIRSAPATAVAPFVTFEKQINIGSAKSVTICYTLPSRAYDQDLSAVILSQNKPGVFYENPLYRSGSFYSGTLGSFEIFHLDTTSDENTWITKTYTISNPGQYNFVTFLPFRIPADYNTSAFVSKVRYIKFNK